ncbi:YwqI/YxiC family protein [Halobacillus shinanisalinarum]|uniref:YwqI/YxiC family protein n=1 Tax=Halobacillus shinanisalinarum TaxID=2932258 RepID=A0ABY4H296_9BACI|nr:YwqI/YxiC family protein [Halobacillus shinanisalinarum]UOQ94571.1 YwqI/YxiC family protein [Halobacillus shinanisalinarum]
MAEIKINRSVAEPVFNDFKSNTNDLDTTKPNLEFNQSTLDFIQKIEEIESTYSQTIRDYKDVLLKAESDAWSNIESFIQIEEAIGSNISKGSGR